MNSADHSAPPAAPRILIVDDLEQNRELLARYLKHRGCEPFEAAGGLQALEMIERNSFDVVLLDMQMPDLNGMEVLRRIRLQRSLMELPVIMITAWPERDFVVEALGAEANDFITKPFEFDVVYARVDTQVRRKRADESIRVANQDLERQLSSLREERTAAAKPDVNFLADMGHELRTPLNGVIGIAGALAGTDLQPRQQELVRIIESSAATLERLLADLLEQGKAHAGRLEIKGENFALGDIVTSVTALWEARARQKGLEFEVVFDTPPDVSVQGDPVRLKQILTNLLSNAVKFTTTGRVALTVSCTDERYRFVVTDNGIGFDAEAKSRLFTRFQQADATISERFGGTGLGLAISRDLAQLMGGALDGESRPGLGATFTLELPLPRVGARESQAATAPRSAPVSLRVVYAEDHPVNRQVMEMLLATMGDGVQLTCVDNGQQAVEAARAGACDLILMDVQMPVMDGLTATRMIREFEAAEAKPPIPIIMVTAHNLSDHLRASVEAGADGHLGKPVNAAELMAALAEHGGRARTGAPVARSAAA